MRRIVDMVGIGDSGTVPSACLQISPLHEYDTGLLILGCLNAASSADYFQIRDHNGTALMCATSGGVFQTANILIPQINATTSTATNFYGTKMNATTVTATTISGGANAKIYATTITATKISAATYLYAHTVTATMISGETGSRIYMDVLTASNISGESTSIIRFATINGTTISGTTVCADVLWNSSASGNVVVSNSTARKVRTTGACATATTVVATAMYIPTPASATVNVRALVSTFCTVGAHATSAAAFQLDGMITEGGRKIFSSLTPLTAAAFSNKESVCALVSANAFGIVGLTFTGSADVQQWAYDVETLTVIAAA